MSDDERPLDEDVPAVHNPRRRVSISDDQGQSAKLALVEARVELDDLRLALVEANSDRSAARLEQKCEREIATRAAQRHEEVVGQLRKEVDAVRELLEGEIVRAEDATNAATEKGRAREAELQAALDASVGAIHNNAAAAIQRVFNKRYMGVLQERYRTALSQAEASEAEHARLRDELEESQRALQSSAARTLQRALMPKMHIAIRAAGGDAAALEALKEQRRLADVRQLEKEQAELRTALNESRRKAAMTNRRLQQAEGGGMIVVNAVRQILCDEMLTLERDTEALVAITYEKLGVTRRQKVHLALKLSAAQAKARVCVQRAADAESTLLSVRQQCEVAQIKAEDAESRAALMQSHALEREQEAALASDAIAKLERKSAVDGHRLAEMVQEAEDAKTGTERRLMGEIAQIKAAAAAAAAAAADELQRTKDEAEVAAQEAWETAKAAEEAAAAAAAKAAKEAAAAGAGAISSAQASAQAALVETCLQMSLKLLGNLGVSLEGLEAEAANDTAPPLGLDGSSGSDLRASAASHPSTPEVKAPGSGGGGSTSGAIEAFEEAGRRRGSLRSSFKGGLDSMSKRRGSMSKEDTGGQGDASMKKGGSGETFNRTRRKSVDRKGDDVLSMALAAPGFGASDGAGAGGVKSLFPAMSAGEGELCAILMSRVAQRSLAKRIDEASKDRARATAAEADAARQRQTDLEASFQRKSQNSNALFETFQRELQANTQELEQTKQELRDAKANHEAALTAALEAKAQQLSVSLAESLAAQMSDAHDALGQAQALLSQANAAHADGGSADADGAGAAAGGEGGGGGGEGDGSPGSPGTTRWPAGKPPPSPQPQQQQQQLPPPKSIDELFARLLDQMADKDRQIADRDAALEFAEQALLEADNRANLKSEQLRQVAYHLSLFLGGTPLVDVAADDQRFGEAGKYVKAFPVEQSAGGIKAFAPPTPASPATAGELVKLLRDHDEAAAAEEQAMAQDEAEALARRRSSNSTAQTLKPISSKPSTPALAPSPSAPAIAQKNHPAGRLPPLTGDPTTSGSPKADRPARRSAETMGKGTPKRTLGTLRKTTTAVVAVAGR